jgi:hypothetical protein
VLQQPMTKHEAYSFLHVTTECLRPAHQLYTPTLTGERYHSKGYIVATGRS